jgi:predicted nucleotidyltransferase
VQFVEAVLKSQLIVSIIVDGSFVTGKESPSDIDLVLVVRSDHDFSADLRPIDYNLLSRRRVRKRFHFDVMLSRADSAEYIDQVAYFQQVKGWEGRRKGGVKVTI